MALVPKRKKNEEGSMTCRPMYLLDALGKLLEVLITLKIQRELEDGNNLSEKQYGFRKGRSTVEALQVVEKERRAPNKWSVIIALDVKNAFNTALWSQIM